MPPRSLRRTGRSIAGRVVLHDTWQNNLNTKLAGTDAMIAGNQIDELAPRDYRRIRLDWSVSGLVDTVLLGADQMAAGDQFTELPPRGYRPIRLDWLYVTPGNTIFVVPAEDIPDGIKGIAWPDERLRSPYDKWLRPDWAYNNIVIQGADAMATGAQEYQDLIPRRPWHMQDHILAAMVNTLTFVEPAVGGGLTGQLLLLGVGA